MNPIELLHPRGYVRKAVVVGECPARLRPTAAPPTRQGTADLVIVGKGADPGDVEVAQDGIVYVLGTRMPVRRTGFSVVEFVHLPNDVQSTHVAALDAAPLSLSRRAQVAAAAARLPLGRSALRLVFDTGTLLFHPGLEPLAWLQEDVRGVVITTSRHGATSTCVVRTAGKVAKVGAGPESVPAGLGEAAALHALGAGATAAGASVPRVLDELDLNDVPVTVQTPVAGRPAARLLRRNPNAARELIERLTSWLVRWNARTLRRNETPSVAVHQDLTMANVLLSGDELGIVDWASARPDGLPLTDFFYAALDARAAVDGYRDRTAAFRQCFLRGGDWYDLVGGLERRLADELSLAGDVADLAFHECWRHHAANEARRGEGAQFRDVAQLAAGAR